MQYNIVEVIKEGEIVRMTESQAIEEDLFILRKVIEPETEPLPAPTPSTPQTPRQREESMKSYSRLEQWRAGKSKIKNNNVLNELLENFNWIISRKRRFKNMSRKQLADAVGVSEEHIKSIEFGELPSDDFVLISKLENYLDINLRREPKQAHVSLSDLQKRDEERNRQEQARQQSPVKTDQFAGSDIEIIE